MIAYGFVRAVVGRSAAVLLCVAGVPVLVVTLVHGFFGVPLSAYRPVINDEVAYWHQALTFTRAGFHGGYYTLGEVTNPSGLTPFGPHGPGFAVLYGTAGSLFGWYRHSAVILNLIAIGAAAWIWASLTRASIPRLLLGAAMLLTFWHMLYWAPTGMQESLHHAGAIAIAGCFAAVLGPYRRWWVIAFGWIALAVLAFVRPSWLLLFPLWAIATTRSSSRRIIAATVVASMVIGTGILFAYSRMTAPYEEGFFFLRAAGLSLGLQALAENVTGNVRRLGMPDQFHPIELLQRYQYGALLLATTIAAVAAMWRTRRTQGLIPHFAIAAAALALALMAMLLLYQFTNFAEHRVLSAFLLFGTMLCIAAPGRLGPALAAGIVIVSLVSARTSLIELEDSWRASVHLGSPQRVRARGRPRRDGGLSPGRLALVQYAADVTVPAAVDWSAGRDRAVGRAKAGADDAPSEIAIPAAGRGRAGRVHRAAQSGDGRDASLRHALRQPRCSLRLTFCEVVPVLAHDSVQLPRTLADNSCRASGGPPFLVEPVTSRDF